MKYAKAFMSAAIAGLAILYIALSDEKVSPAEMVEIASASLVAFGATWAVPNKPTFSCD